MLKRLLFTMVLAFSFSLVMNAQTGTLDNLSFDANVAPGQTGLTFSCDYTASAAGTYEWQLIKALPDGSPDWAAGSTVYSTGAITMATTATPLTINYDVPASADTGTYTWAGKLTINGTDLAYNNTGNLVVIGSNTGVPTGSLTNLVFDTTVIKGATGLTFSFDYMANDFIANNIPIDGIGLQMHISVGTSPNNFPRAFESVVETGLLVHLSELDIKIDADDFTEEVAYLQERQYQRVAYYYSNLVPEAQQFGITLWGFRDQDSWLFTATERPLVFDGAYNTKVAHRGLIAGVEGNPVF